MSSAPAATPSPPDAGAALLAKHASEKRLLAGRVAKLTKPPPQGKSLTPAAAAAEGAKLTAELEARQARELADLAAGKLAAPTASVPSSLPPAPSALPPPPPAPASRKAAETAAITALLAPHGLTIRTVPADGSCMFRAVEDQLRLLGASPVPTQAELRGRAASYIRLHAAEFAPFLPYEESDGYSPSGDPTAAVGRYCARLATSSAWGGHPELRALCATLGRHITVFQDSVPPHFSVTPAGVETLSSEAALGPASGAMRLSYHREYYTSGEHWNSVWSRTG